MRHVVGLGLILLGFGGFLASEFSVYAADPGDHAALITIDGVIEPISAGYLSRGIDKATGDEAQLAVVVVDTPGGLLSPTRDMVGDILASEIPIVTYVYPPGARAASAGTFVTAAGHVAAMAPATNIGAASPVAGGGEELPETLKSKATQDAAAFMRDIAAQRDRNADALESTVLNAASYSSSEALEENLVDLIAEDLDDLLRRLDGRTVSLTSRDVVLETEGLALRAIDRTLVERFLGFLADPNIAFLLLAIGGIGVLVEVLNPGMIVPGLAGVIALALAFLAAGSLPVNWVGVGLLGLAMFLFFLEMQAAGIGVFGVGGAVSFVLGAFLLFGRFDPEPIPAPSFGVSLWTIGVVSAILFAFLVLFFRGVLQARRASYPTPAQAIVGQEGVATTDLNPRGTVRVASELWSAVSDSGEPIPEGEDVMVTDIEGLTLKVFKTPKGRRSSCRQASS